MQQVKENKMGTMPINKLLFGMSVPMMISMLVQALYNIVDSIFVSHYSNDALTAVSLAFPIQNLMIAVGVGTAVGINSLLSRKLGEKNYEEANLIASNGLFLALISWVIFAVLGFLLSEQFFYYFTDDLTILKMGKEYLFICTVFSFGVFMQITLERIMQSTGNTVYNMIVQMTGAIINIILDPILIFGLFGLPSLGVAGAAIATVIGQVCAMLLGFFLVFAKIKEVKIDFKGFKPNGKIIKAIYFIGIPSILMQSIGTILTICLNKILIIFSNDAVSVYGVYFKLQSFVFMPIFGLTHAVIPIVAFNYGAKNKQRITSTVKLSVIASVSIMLLGVLIFRIFPKQLLYIFDATPEMISIGVPALKTISLSFVFAGACIILSSVFQAFGNGFLSMAMSMVRQLAVVLPASYLFAKFIGLDALWYAFPLSELVSTTLCLIMFRWIYNKYIRNL